MLFEILSDILKIDDVLFILKNNGVVSEIRSNSLPIKQKDDWITIGDSDGPCHMHINQNMIKTVKFITEEKPEKTSFSIQFFSEYNDRLLGAFFTKMYDEKVLKNSRKKLYDHLLQKYGYQINLK